MKKFIFSLLFLIPFLTFSQDCTQLYIYMVDDYGDGWNGNTLSINDDSITLLNGEEGIDSLCINLDECNSIIVGGGSWQEEVSWTIEESISGEVLLVGGAPFDSTIGCDIVHGCTDPNAFNYNDEANINDGSCYPKVYGCMNPNSYSYNDYDGDGIGNPLTGIPGIDVNTENNLCTPFIYGCLDTIALNYNPEANTDNESCEYPSCLGFEDYWVENICDIGLNGQTLIYWNWITENIPSCEVIGIGIGNGQESEFLPINIPPGSVDYGQWVGTGPQSPLWSQEHYFYVEFADNSISDTLYYTPDPCIFGCMNPEADNYNPWANNDVGCSNSSCSPGLVPITIEITLDQYASETSWILTDISNGQEIEAVLPGEYDFSDANSTIFYNICVPVTGFEFIINDSYGDGLAGSEWGGTDGNVIITGDILPCGDLDVIWELPNANFGNVTYSGATWLPPCEIIQEVGCTDPEYIEYNPTAEINLPFACITPKIYGCTDSTAFNFNPEANTSEIIPNCPYTIILEDDGGDGWGNSYIGVIQEENEWIFSVPPGLYSKSWPIMLKADKVVEVMYFQLGPPQAPIQELEFQTLHNSFRIMGPGNEQLLGGGNNPFANNGQGALQPFAPPVFKKYTAIPYCGDYCIPTIVGCMDEGAFNYNYEANTSGDCIEIIEGCTNDLAFNYNPEANIDNDSCEPFIYGCMDNIAWNYNPDANVADESCLYFGCTDQIALNFDPLANVNNNNCIYPIPGCTNPNAFNFNIDANVNDGSCIPVILGCMDPTMWNYNENANTESENCIPFIYGCTENLALNYNPLANIDNGSCIPLIPGCMDNTALNYNLEATLEDGSCIEILFGCMDSLAFNYNYLANVDNESCIDFIYGCTDPNAFNYNPSANTEDFSCIEIIYGCMDINAFNYDELANTDNGSCIEIIEGCMDPLAFNYNFEANTENESCLYDAGCVGEPGEPYWLNDSCYAWVIIADPYCCNQGWDEKCQLLYNYCNEEFSIGLDDLRDNEVLIYPNPSTDIINIISKNDIKINVTNLFGEILLTIENEKIIDLSPFSNGLYIFNITYNNVKIQHKVIKY